MAFKLQVFEAYSTVQCKRYGSGAAYRTVRDQKRVAYVVESYVLPRTINSVLNIWVMYAHLFRELMIDQSYRHICLLIVQGAKYGGCLRY